MEMSGLFLAFFSPLCGLSVVFAYKEQLPITFDIHFVVIYLSYRWLNGKMAMMMHS